MSGLLGVSQLFIQLAPVIAVSIDWIRRGIVLEYSDGFDDRSNWLDKATDKLESIAHVNTFLIDKCIC
jgi:hypothetical protein